MASNQFQKIKFNRSNKTTRIVSFLVVVVDLMVLMTPEAEVVSTSAIEFLGEFLNQIFVPN